MFIRLSIVGGAAIALVAFATVAFQESSSAQKLRPTGPYTRLPENPFESVREGDWASYVMHLSEGGAPAVTQAVLWRIVSVKGDVVTQTLATRASDGRLVEGAPREFLKSRAPTIETYFRVPRVPMSIDDVTIDEGCFAFEKRALSCRKISFRCRGADGNDGSASVVALVSPEIPGGIASLNVAITDKFHITGIEYELAGFGTAEGKTLGKTVDEIAVPAEGGK